MLQVQPYLQNEIPCGTCHEKQGGMLVNHTENGATHVHHRDCLNTWLQTHDTCPDCRVQLDKSSLQALFSWTERLQNAISTIKRFSVNAVAGAVAGTASAAMGALSGAMCVGSAAIKIVSRRALEEAAKGLGDIASAVLGTAGAVAAGTALKGPAERAYEWMREKLDWTTGRAEQAGADAEAVKAGIFASYAYGFWAMLRLPQYKWQIPCMGMLIGGAVASTLSIKPHAFDWIRRFDILGNL